MIHDEIEREQAVVDRAYALLERARAVEEARGLGPAEGGHRQDRLEAEARRATQLLSSAAMAVGDAPLCFGRIDDDQGQRWYIGRVGVSDERLDPVVVDWRAPVAAPFYRATGRHPLGLVARRTFGCRHRQIIAVDDERFDGTHPVDATGLVGDAALLAALDAPRSAGLGDIVATVQAEQDEVIRAPLAGVTVVQGGAGTGKTVVALHRAAYLLYTHRQELGLRGVLLVGPNATFLGYVNDVLPSLGEHAVTLLTPDTLLPGFRVTGTEPPEVAALKGDGRMAQVVARAVRTRQRPPRRDEFVPYQRHRLLLTQAEGEAIVRRWRRRDGAHNERRPGVERQILRALYRDAEAKRDRAVGDRVAAAAPLPAFGAFAADLKATPEGAALLDRLWPVLTPQQLLTDLFGSAALIAAAGKGVLDEREQALLARPRASAFTSADVALADEAAWLLGVLPEKTRRRPAPSEDLEYLADRVIEQVVESLAADDEVVANAQVIDHKMEEDLRRAITASMLDEETPPPAERPIADVYGHVLVDEAQDLSVMQWRAIARRAPNRSITLVGDLAQATSPGAAGSWEAVEAGLGLAEAGRPLTRCDLAVNYRTPAEVVAVADRVAAVAFPGLTAATAVRHAGRRPEVVHTDGDLIEAVRAEAEALIAAEPDRTLAIVVPAAAEADWRVAHLPAGAPSPLGVRAPVCTAVTAKGLEFDHVIVVEPAAIASGSAGLRHLYIALTRCTQRLVLVHRDPLPGPLAEAVEAGELTVG